MARSSNIVDVARRAGVSKSTVSRVLNGQPHVSAAAQQRIRDAIHELGFEPNPSARSIVLGSTRTVGLLVPNLSSPFYVEIVEGILSEISGHEYGLLLYGSEDKDEAFLKKVFVRGKTDGLIAITPRFREQSFVEAFAGEQPFVLINHRNTTIDAPYACFDNYSGGGEAARYLIELGHTRVACFAGRRTSQSTRDRLDGFRDALARAGVTLREEWLRVKGEHFEESVVPTLLSWAAAGSLPTAVFTYNDLTALEVIAGLHELGIAVPDGVSVLGFDDIRMARHSRPPLTTVSQSPELLGRSGARMLLDLIEGRPLGETRVTIAPRLVVRESCAPPATGPTAQPSGWNRAKYSQGGTK
jgi:LacI family transcriptional regulator